MKYNEDSHASPIALRRRALGLTQAQLAEISGVNFRMIQHYEQGVKDISHAPAFKVYCIAKALGCTVEDLIK